MIRIIKELEKKYNVKRVGMAIKVHPTGMRTITVEAMGETATYENHIEDLRAGGIEQILDNMMSALTATSLAKKVIA